MLLVPETIEQYREQFRQALEAQDIGQAVQMGAQLSSARVASIMTEAPRAAIVPALLEMEPNRAGRVIAQLPVAFSSRLFESVDHETATELLGRVPPDFAKNIIEAIDAERRQALLEAIDPALRDKIEQLARYRAGTVGSVMSPRFLSIRRDRTVRETMDAVISAPPDVQRTHYIYVVDDGNRLVGVVSLRDMVRYPSSRIVGEIMVHHVVAVHVDDSVDEAVQQVRNRRLMMIPVVEEAGVIAGVLTFEDAMDLQAMSVADQFAGLGASSPDESFFTPPMASVRGRLPWMAANVFLNLGAVAVITSFEETIATVAILAAFLPMITDMGGNVGIQSLSVAIRSLALGEVRLRDFWSAVRKELLIGLVNGMALGVLFSLVAWVWQGNPWIGALAGIALGVNVLLAGVIGGTLPFLIKRIGRDPAMMTGPVLTTITDITGVSIYLGLCTIFLANLVGG